MTQREFFHTKYYFEIPLE